jgi:hypothetical protein
MASLNNLTNLDLAVANNETYHLAVFGQPLKVHHYQACYVENPTPIYENGQVTNAYQSLQLYIPEHATANSPIILAVDNGGWMASKSSDRNDAYFEINDGDAFHFGHSSTLWMNPVEEQVQHTEVAGLFLQAGYVIATPGNRRRDQQNEAGEYVSHAPANIVDIKAAIRYLRYNAGKFKGDTEKIFVTGFSGGGALSASIAATGNHSDFYPYLKEIGAAGILEKDGELHSTIKDDVFGVLSYCPVTDLANADAAYEWTFQSVRNYTGEQKALADQLVREFEHYLEHLDLKLEDGQTTLSGANLEEKLTTLLENGAQKAYTKNKETHFFNDSNSLIYEDEGESYFYNSKRFPVTKYTIPNNWLTIHADDSLSIDYKHYLLYGTHSFLKNAPAFDNFGTDYQGMINESSIFGSKTQAYSKFTEWSWNHNTRQDGGIGYKNTKQTWKEYLQTSDGQDLLKQMALNSPILYLVEKTDQTTIAPHWYVRHGMQDYGSVPLATIVVLYYALFNCSKVTDLDFAFAWMAEHAGYYDAAEACAWINETCAKAMVVD